MPKIIEKENQHNGKDLNNQGEEIQKKIDELRETKNKEINRMLKSDLKIENSRYKENKESKKLMGEDEEIEEFKEKISSKLTGAVEKYLSEDPELKKVTEDLLPGIIKNSEIEYESMTSQDEELTLKEVDRMCQNKDDFIKEIKRIAKEVEEENTLPENKGADNENLNEEGEDTKEDQTSVNKDDENSEKIVLPKSLDENLELSKEEVEKTRAVYFAEYKKCKNEADRQNLINRTKNSILNLFKKKENKVHFKAEDLQTEKLTESKKEYNQARREMGEAMYAKQKAEFEKAGLSGDDLKKALLNYKSTEILTETIIKERQKLIDSKDSPLKPALWKKLLGGYQKLSKTQKVLLSTTLFMAAASAGIVSGGIFAGYGLANMALIKFGASMAIGTVVEHSVRGIDWANKKSDFNFARTQLDAQQKYKEEFSSGVITQETYEKNIENLENEKSKRERNRIIWKTAAGIAIAAVAGYAAYDALGNGLSQTDLQSGVDGATGPDINHSVVSPVENVPKVIEHANVEAVADNGQGAISTLRELQANLKTEYNSDLTSNPDRVPESVKHILNTDAHKLAQEYGMYKPGQDAESVMIKSGDKFMVDQSGNIKFGDTILEKGTEIKASAVYEGKMYDTDNSGLEQNTPSEIPQYTPEGVEDSNIGASYLENNQMDPRLPGNNIDNNTEFKPAYDPSQQETSGTEDQAEVSKTNFSERELRQIKRIENHNLNHIFPNDTEDQTWNKVKSWHANKLYSIEENQIKPEYKGLSTYLHKLHEVTGLEPRGEGALTGAEAETNSEFIERAVKKATELGKLKEIKL